MDLKEMIYKRKSIRSFNPKEVDNIYIRKIEEFSGNLVGLNNNIKVHCEIIGNDKVKGILPWRAPHYIAIFSEEKENYLTNVGFMYQQLELYIQSLGLGTCWLGMGKYDSNFVDSGSEEKFVIMIAFGKSESELYRNNINEFKRKQLSEIADSVDEKLEFARLAPSAINSQPWYFVHEENNILHAYCANANPITGLAIGKFNKIDMGIALAHMYVSNINTFEFLGEIEHPKIKGCSYIGSFKI